MPWRQFPGQTCDDPPPGPAKPAFSSDFREGRKVPLAEVTAALVVCRRHMRYLLEHSRSGDRKRMSGNETRIKRQGESGGGEALDDISTQINRDASNQVIGKLTVVEGPGAGKTVKLFSGTNQIGRGDDMRVQINFGDDTISRQQHAVITYDTKKLEARIYDGGKPGGLWVNGARVTADQAVKYGDLIKIGETTLKLEQA
jgi:hypothetical protein